MHSGTCMLSWRIVSLLVPGFGFYVNPYLTNGFSHHYHLDESTFILGVLRVIFIFISFFNEISQCKQNSPRWEWDAAFCGVTSGAMLFAYVPQKGRQA